MGPGESTGPTHSRSSAKASELGRRCALFTTPLKDRQQTHVCQAHVSLVAFNPLASSSLIEALNAGNGNRSDRWFRSRIRCSRVALPPKAPSGETTVASGFWGITLSGMTHPALNPAPARRFPWRIRGSGRSLYSSREHQWHSSGTKASSAKLSRSQKARWKERNCQIGASAAGSGGSGAYAIRALSDLWDRSCNLWRTV